MNIRFYNAKILLTKEHHKFELIQGELWVKGNRIAYVGPEDQAGASVRGEEIIVWDRSIDVNGNLLMCGFKDAHTHSAMTFLRSYADDLPLERWLQESVFPKEALLQEDEAYWLNLLGIMEYLTSGITSNFDMYIYTDAHTRASLDSGFRTVQTSGFNDFVSSVEEMEEQYHRINEMGDLVSFIPGFHAQYTTSLSHMEDLAKLVQKLQAPVFFHNAETEKEILESKEKYGKTPTALAEAIGLYEYGGGGYHCIWMEEEDLEIFRRRGLYAVTNPCSNLKLASGLAPVARMLKEQIPVALGTDGPASNNALDMFREMYLMTTLAKLRERDAAAVPAEEVLYSATAEGAHAMGLWDCDEIAVGKLADLIIIDLQQPNMQPENNIVKNIVYSGSKQNVLMTMVNGKILYEKGEFQIGFDQQEIYQRANAIIQRMKS